MKKWLKILIILSSFLFAVPAFAADYYSGGNSWLIKSDCSAVIKNGYGCYNSSTHAFCIGNGSSCAAISGTTVTVVDALNSTSSTSALSAGQGKILNDGKAPAFTSSTANYFWATPNGIAGVPTLRAIVAADIPALNYAPVNPLATDTIFDAAGDLVQGTGADTAAKLTKGAVGTVLRAGATLNAYSTFTIADTFAKGSFPVATTANTLTALAHPGAANYFLYTNATDTMAWLLGTSLVALAGTTNPITVSGNNVTFPGTIASTAADGSRKLSVTANTVGVSPTATSFEMYPDSDNIWKTNQNGTEYSNVLGPTGTQINFSGTLTNGYLCTFATGGAMSCNTNPASYFTASTTLGSWTSGAGTVASGDTYLAALQKIDGNVGAKAPIASPTFTGVVTVPGSPDCPVLSNVALTGTQNILIDGNAYCDYTYGNGTDAGATAYTTIFTTPPASGKVRYITLTVTAGANHAIAMTWTGVSWIGTTGAASVAVTKSSMYVCIIPNTGNARCKIVQEG